MSGAPAGEEPHLAGLDLPESLQSHLAPQGGQAGHADIKLRERGTKKLHIFTGDRVQVDKPKGAPAWMPAKIWKPMVKKVGIENLEKPEPPGEKVVVVKRTRK